MLAAADWFREGFNQRAVVYELTGCDRVTFVAIVGEQACPAD